MDLTPGIVFGEITLLFNKPSTYSVKTTTEIECLVITYVDLKRDFKRLLYGMVPFFEKRNSFIE